MILPKIKLFYTEKLLIIRSINKMHIKNITRLIFPKYIYIYKYKLYL